MRAQSKLALLSVALLAWLAAGGIGAGASAAPPRTTPAHAAGSAATASTWADWYAYHGTGRRYGNDTQLPPVGKLVITHRLALDGAVYAAPIVVLGVTIVATENDTVYAFSPTYQ